MKEMITPNRSIFLAIVASVAASICCVGPLVLITLGISGAWISTLTQFEVIRPIAISVTVLFVSFAFYKIYKQPKSCDSEKVCSKEGYKKANKTILWIAVLIIGLLISFPWYAPLFY